MDTDIFSTETDSTTPAEPESNSSWTDIFASASDSATSTNDTPASEWESTSTEPSLASDFSVDGSETLDQPIAFSEYSPFPEFSSFPETSPVPESAIAFADSGSSPESTSSSEDIFSFDSPPGLEADSSASDMSFLERNSPPETETPEGGEGSNFISGEYAPSDEPTFSFLSSEDPNNVQDRSFSAPDENYLLPDDGALGAEVPELGEGSNFIPTEPAPSGDYSGSLIAGGADGVAFT